MVYTKENFIVCEHYLMDFNALVVFYFSYFSSPHDESNEL